MKTEKEKKERKRYLSKKHYENNLKIRNENHKQMWNKLGDEEKLEIINRKAKEIEDDKLD